MQKKSTHIIFFLFFISQLVAQTKLDIIYKQVGGVKLNMVINYPENINQNDFLPAMIFFFGGGWETGNKTQFQYYAVNYAQKGIITILADYRISSLHGTTPFESLKDAKSAVRYLKQHADELQIDTTRLIASGGSAGGHLAAACFTNETINEDTDKLEFSSKPKVLVLFNPAIDNSINGYGYDRLGDRWEEFSPMHNVRSPFPPTIFLLGTKDNLIPVSTGQEFKRKVENVGGRCDLILFTDAKHGFFNLVEYRDEVISQLDGFLKSLDYLPGYETSLNYIKENQTHKTIIDLNGRKLRIKHPECNYQANVFSMNGTYMGKVKSGTNFQFNYPGSYLVQVDMIDSIYKKVITVL